MVLHYQPKHLSGRIYGIEMFIGNNLRGLGTLCVYLFYDIDNNHSSFWYSQIIVESVIIVALIAALIVEMVYKQSKSHSRDSR